VNIEIRSSKDQSGTMVYIATVTIDGGQTFSRAFRSKDDAERFKEQETSRLLNEAKHAPRPPR
jgi:hypothetical protein